MNTLHSIAKIIDSLNIFIGKLISWLVPIIMLEMIYEIIARYIFNAPTNWSYDISYMLGGTFFWLGAAYTLLIGKHVRVDIFYTRFSPRVRAGIDVVLMTTFFFPLFIALLYYALPWSYQSWVSGEKSLETFWRPIVYPFKAILSLGLILLLLQGAANFIKNILILSERRAL
jgi:TRAP-type mannitol/chloroaromatic compound transport system permease small subunit